MRVIFVATDLAAVAKDAAPWATVIREGRMGFWCAESEAALRAALNS